MSLQVLCDYFYLCLGAIDFRVTGNIVSFLFAGNMKNIVLLVLKNFVT